MADSTSELPIIMQCHILSLNRSSLYYKNVEPINCEDLKIMNAIDQIYTEYPFLGHRRIRDELQDEHHIKIGRHRVRGYMNAMGIQAFYPRRKINTSMPNKDHKIYPYLLRKKN
jgi:putative transposase